MQRELVIKVDGRGVDDDAANILVYRLSDRVSLVATTQNNGDAEVLLDKADAMALAKALQNMS